jgi:hypothetical protein
MKGRNKHGSRNSNKHGSRNSNKHGSRKTALRYTPGNCKSSSDKLPFKRVSHPSARIRPGDAQCLNEREWHARTQMLRNSVGREDSALSASLFNITTTTMCKLSVSPNKLATYKFVMSVPDTPYLPRSLSEQFDPTKPGSRGYK